MVTMLRSSVITAFVGAERLTTKLRLVWLRVLPMMGTATVAVVSPARNVTVPDFAV